MYAENCVSGWLSQSWLREDPEVVVLPSSPCNLSRLRMFLFSSPGRSSCLWFHGADKSDYSNTGGDLPLWSCAQSNSYDVKLTLCETMEMACDTQSSYSCSYWRLRAGARWWAGFKVHPEQVSVVHFKQGQIASKEIRKWTRCSCVY